MPPSDPRRQYLALTLDPDDFDGMKRTPAAQELDRDQSFLEKFQNNF
jgi:hypothetical protein